MDEHEERYTSELFDHPITNYVNRGGLYEPLDSHVWQYAILTERGVSALKFEKVE